MASGTFVGLNDGWFLEVRNAQDDGEETDVEEGDPIGVVIFLRDGKQGKPESAIYLPGPNLRDVVLAMLLESGQTLDEED